MEPDESELVLRARDGDGRAFEALARRYETRLYSHVLRIAGTESDAQDVVQDAFISAWRSMAAFEGAHFRAWLFRIATNRAIDLIRARRRRGELPLEPESDEDGPAWAEPAAPGPDLAELAGRSEALSLVEAALGTIPAEQRAALLLRDVEGFDYAEIAQITASEIGTVKSRIHRGRLAVRNALVRRGWTGAAG